MRIIPTLSHMPYLNNGKLYFCASPGVAVFKQPQTSFEIQQGMSVRETKFQPWSPAFYENGNVTPLACNLWTNSPMRVFCNLVACGEHVSFIFARKLYTARISGNQIVGSQPVVSGLFTGFSDGLRVAIGKAPCTEGSQIILINGTERRALDTVLDSLLRIIPHGDGIIITGRKGDAFISALLIGEDAYRITANGLDVYKCCLTADNAEVIHAVRAGGFEERYLHREPATLTKMHLLLRKN